MAIIPLPGIVIPQGAGPAPTTAGQIRYNTDGTGMEVWSGTHWYSVGKATPVTWQDWFDYHVLDTRDISDRHQRQQQIRQLMQERFPGQYRVDLANDTWQMIHDTPADETWFNLKYAQ